MPIPIIILSCLILALSANWRGNECTLLLVGDYSWPRPAPGANPRLWTKKRRSCNIQQNGAPYRKPSPMTDAIAGDPPVYDALAQAKGLLRSVRAARSQRWCQKMPFRSQVLSMSRPRRTAARSFCYRVLRPIQGILHPIPAFRCSLCKQAGAIRSPIHASQSWEEAHVLPSRTSARR